MDMTRAQAVRFAELLSRGELILFTGAGFSAGAFDFAARNLPTGRALCRELWPIAFPDMPVDEASALGDVFDCALKTARRKTAELLTSRLTVDPLSLPDYYRLWFSQPWLRIYSLNVDNLDEEVGRHFGLPRDIRSVSALSSEFPDLRSGLYSIHLNGKLADVPDVTFSPPQYGARLAAPEAWYQALVADITSRPVVFVGTELNESLLWQYLSLRSFRRPDQHELRPGSYLVAPDISAARRSLLETYNITWIQGSAEEFAFEVLAQFESQTQAGLRRIATREGLLDAPLIESVAVLRGATSSEIPHDFLLGRAPVWNDLVTGYAIRRQFEAELPGMIADGSSLITVLTGTAGSGKSTTLMGIALALQAAGLDTWWMDPDAWPASSDVRTALGTNVPQVLVIDDLNRLGVSALGIMRSAIAEHPGLRIVAAARSTTAALARLDELTSTGQAQTISVPPLEDADIDGLIQVLDRANRLGALKGMSPLERRKVLRDKWGRQLLVAMLEATSGVRFEEKITSECRELPSGSAYLYAVVCLATSEGHWLSQDECLDAGGMVANDALVAFRRLTQAHMVVESAGKYRARHRVIAERAVSFYTDEGQIIEPIMGLAAAVARRVYRNMPKSARERRLLNRLINHEWVFRHTKLQGARRVYQAVETCVDWDLQFWLQRGRFELEHGALPSARNFLAQALSLEPSNLWVRSAWSQLVIQEVTRSADPASGADDVAGAFSDLEEIIQMVGQRDIHPYHVLGLRGMMWARQARLSNPDRVAVLLRLRKSVAEGCKLHPWSTELEAISNQLEREYLMTAVE